MKVRPLSAYWCKHCRQVVVHAIPRAEVWCRCGRRAVEVPAGGQQQALALEKGGVPRDAA